MGLFSPSGGSDAGNIFLMGDPNKGDAGDYTRAVGQGLTKRGLDETEGLGYGKGVADIQNNAVLGQLFGKGGQMEQTNQQVSDLSKRGYSLQPEDYEAYGQASGNIARMFGGQEQGLAESLASRGLSNSGAAGQQFSNLFGNKQEQLAGLQTKIAQDRMQMNQQRLAQMQNFLSTLGGQAQSGINSANQTEASNAEQKYKTGMGFLGQIQNQNNIAMEQRQQSQGPSFGQELSGGLGILSQGAGLASGLGGMMGGGALSGSKKAMAGQSYTSGGAIS